MLQRSWRRTGDEEQAKENYNMKPGPCCMKGYLILRRKRVCNENSSPYKPRHFVITNTYIQQREGKYLHQNVIDITRSYLTMSHNVSE